MEKSVHVLPESVCIERREDRARENTLEERDGVISDGAQRRDRGIKMFGLNFVFLAVLTPVIVLFFVLEAEMIKIAWPTAFSIAGLGAVLGAFWLHAFKRLRCAYRDIRGIPASKRRRRLNSRQGNPLGDRMQIAVLTFFSGGCIFRIWVATKAFVIGFWPIGIIFGLWSFGAILIVGALLRGDVIASAFFRKRNH